MTPYSPRAEAALAIYLLGLIAGAALVLGCTCAALALLGSAG